VGLENHLYMWTAAIAKRTRWAASVFHRSEWQYTPGQTAGNIPSEEFDHTVHYARLYGAGGCIPFGASPFVMDGGTSGKDAYNNGTFNHFAMRRSYYNPLPAGGMCAAVRSRSTIRNICWSRLADRAWVPKVRRCRAESGEGGTEYAICYTHLQRS
jgi:hypothetical protein